MKILCNYYPIAVLGNRYNSDSPRMHNNAELNIEFNCTKYESTDIDEKAKILLKNYQTYMLGGEK